VAGVCRIVFVPASWGFFSNIRRSRQKREKKKKLPNTKIESGRGHFSDNATHSGIAIVWGTISLIAETQCARTMRNLLASWVMTKDDGAALMITDRPIASFSHGHTSSKSRRSPH
jgi:hypothetical protein